MGRHFLHNGWGFEATAPISIFFKGKQGVVASAGAKMILKGPGVTAIQFDPAVKVVNTGSDFIEVELPAGTFHFQ